MQPAVKYCTDRPGMEDKIRGALTPAATRAQHLDGAADPELVSPDSWTLDQYWMDSPGRAQAMLDLQYDYQSNVALYPVWQRWLRTYQPLLLLPWGSNDSFFPEAGARAYLEDVPGAELHLLDGGHFVLDEYVDTVADLIRDFIFMRRSNGPPLIPTAFWMRPRASGLTWSRPTAIEPNDCPITVTFAGSPPKLAMLRLIHWRAATMSRYA
jgi:hypothetical protein